MSENHAYLAGFFDADGCVTLVPTNRTMKYYHSLRASLANNDFTVLEWVKGLYGGTVRKTHKSTTNEVGCSEWNCTANGSVIFLEDIYPYIKVKKKQVALAIIYYKLKEADKSREYVKVAQTCIVFDTLLKRLKRTPDKSILKLAESIISNNGNLLKGTNYATGESTG